MHVDRDIRQRDIIARERLAARTATVLGVGAIGRQVALQCAAIGVPSLMLIDPDTVAPENLACQGYLEDDLGRRKVDATANLCQQVNHELAVESVGHRFRRSMLVSDTVFCCVDSISDRQFIWEALSDRASFFVDGRMTAEVLRVVTACDAHSMKQYQTTLFAQEEAHVGPCTARSTIYCANIAAGLMVAHFARWLRGLPVEADISLNLLCDELVVS